MNMYDASVPVFTHFLRSLSAILKKAEAHCAAKKIDPAVILNARLFPDMFAFTRQVQIASDAAKGAGARLAGIAVPSYPDEEKSFEDLQARIAKTIDFLAGLPVLEGAGVGTGGDWPPEPSFLVLGIGAEAAVDIGRAFGQVAIVVGRRGEPARLRFCAAAEPPFEP